MISKRFRFIFVLALLGPSLWAQQNEKQIAFRELTVENGLSQNSVVSITQDQTGFMWFATQDGLNKYDGRDFKIYNEQFEDVTRPNFSKLGKVWNDDQGIMWIITDSGVLKRFNQKSDSFETIDDIRNVSSIFQRSDGSILFGTYDNGLYIYDKSTAEFDQLFDEADAKSGVGDLLEHQDTLYLATLNGYKRMILDGVHAQSAENHNDLPVSTWAGNNESDLWAGTYGRGLHRKTNSEEGFNLFTGFRDEGLPPNLIILDLLIDQRNRLWVGTYGDGVYMIDLNQSRIRHFRANKTNPYALHYNDILCLYEDATGMIWFGTDGAGLSYYDEHLAKFNVLTNNQLPSEVHVDQIRAIAVDEESTIWLGTSGKGLTKIGDETNNAYSYTVQNSGLKSNRVMSLHATENELLIGLQANGLQKLTNNAAFKDFPELEGQTIWKIVPYANDLYWLCTRDSGIILYSISTGIVEAFSTENTSLRTNNIRTIEQHSDYEWWIGSEDAGVYLLDKKSKSVKPIRYTPERIKSLYDDGTYLWIGSNGSGLIAYGIESEEIRSYTKNEGLPNNVIYGILPSGPSQLWVSSNRGLSRFDYNDIDNPLIENYSNYDGLQAFEFNTGAYTKDGNGTLYFGGLEGLNWFNPGDLTFNAALPNTVISSLALFNEDVEMAASHRFKHNENTLTFNYAGLHFSQPERNQYKYRLLEHDADWIDVGNVTSAHYTNLSPGDYEFQVMSSNYDGRWNETPATLQFTISKPWYASNFAFITYALMLMFTAFLVYRYLKWRWEIKMQLQLEHAETERLKKLDEFKTKLYTNISHEFKTPLTLISGPINQQLSKPDLSLDDRSDLNMVKRNSKRLLNLVNQLLDLSKLESGNIKLQVSKGNLSALLNQLVAAFEFKAKEKNIDFNATLKIASEVYFDRDVIEKIVTNLLSNAIKYSPHNGMVQINSFINDGQLVFSVTNDGNTLDKEDLPRLFKRFYQTSKNSEGVGVGLALVKELATLSHGQVIAQISDPDLIQFTLTIPIERSYYNRSELRESPSDLLEVDEMNEALALNPDDIIGDEKPLLLVVEDDAEIRRYIQSIFEKDYKLIKAADGKSGCEKAINQIPDLIISDIMMPGMDGLELSSTLKLDERTSHIPIILLTAKSGDEHEMEGLKTGADAYVTKPFRAANLKIRVDQLIDLRRKLRQRYDQEADVNPKELSLSTADQRFFERLQKILDTQLTDPQFNADRFASEMAMSRMQLHRKLKALTGLSSSEFIRSQRIKMAVKILKTREVSVSELAYDIGFNTPSYFIKCFKEALGQTPLEYQKRS